MQKSLLPLLTLLFTFTQLFAQDYEQAYKVYTNALKLYEQQQTASAIEEFEKVLTLNPKHNNALFNLAVINYDLGNKEKAALLLQACAKLGDKEAAKMLREQLNEKVAFADTMHYNTVDVTPKVLVHAVEEEVLVDAGLNKTIEKSLITELKKSKLLRKQVGDGGFLVLSLYFSKDGSLNALIVTPNKTETAQQEVTSALQKVVRAILENTVEKKSLSGG
jgi:tetratricopeptide (TPR) repeat protein